MTTVVGAYAFQDAERTTWGPLSLRPEHRHLGERETAPALNYPILTNYIQTLYKRQDA